MLSVMPEHRQWEACEGEAFLVPLDLIVPKTDSLAAFFIPHPISDHTHTNTFEGWCDMEELQDAIEDVQYLQAVNSKDSGPSPTEPWPFPSEKELEEFNAERLEKDGKCYSLERICSGVLGLYLVSHPPLG